MSDSCNPMDCNPPGLSVQRIFQARSLEWVAISFSKESSQPRDWTRASELSLLWASWHNRCPNMNVLGKFCTVPKQSRREGCDGGAGICIIPPTTSSVWACTGGTCLFQEHSLTFFFFFFLVGRLKLFYWGGLGEGQRANEQWDLSSFSPASP